MIHSYLASSYMYMAVRYKPNSNVLSGISDQADCQMAHMGLEPMILWLEI